MDELIFEGFKYISSKRAAEVTGYAKDYVGQLCRTGKVKARLVGRTWYVEEVGILIHRKLPKEARALETVGEKGESQAWIAEKTELEAISPDIEARKDSRVSDRQENITLQGREVLIKTESAIPDIEGTEEVNKLEQHEENNKEFRQAEAPQGVDLATAREIMLASILKRTREEVLPEKDSWSQNSYLAKTITAVLLAFLFSIGVNILLVRVDTATPNSISSQVRVTTVASSIVSLKLYLELFSRGE